MEFILHHTVKLLKLIILNGKHENKIVTKCNIHRIIKNVKKWTCASKLLQWICIHIISIYNIVTHTVAYKLLIYIIMIFNYLYMLDIVFPFEGLLLKTLLLYKYCNNRISTQKDSLVWIKNINSYKQGFSSNH